MYPIRLRPANRGWAPAPRRMILAQEMPARPVALIDKPSVSAVIDGVGAASSAVLSYSFGTVGSKWAYVFGFLAGAFTLKGLYDLSRVGKV